VSIVSLGLVVGCYDVDYVLLLDYKLSNVQENYEAVNDVGAQEEEDVQDEGLNGDVEEEANVFFVVCYKQNVFDVS